MFSLLRTLNNLRASKRAGKNRFLEVLGLYARNPVTGKMPGSAAARTLLMLANLRNRLRGRKQV